jgi:hypothetical protein
MPSYLSQGWLVETSFTGPTSEINKYIPRRMKGYPNAEGGHNQHDGDSNHNTLEGRPRDVAEGQAKTLNGKKK